MLFESVGPAGALIRKISNVEINDIFSSALAAGTARDSTLDTGADLNVEDLQQLEATQIGSTSARTYLHYLRAVGWHRMMVYILLLLLAIAIQTVTPVYLQIWSTFNDTHDDADARRKLGVFLGGYAVFEVAYSIALTSLFYYLIMEITLRAALALHTGQFSALMKVPAEFFSTTPVGQILSRFSQDIFIIDDLFPIR